MCVSSWRMTRPQLNGFGTPLAVGEAIATTLPVQAPMVCRSGSPTVRPLNISCELNTSMRIFPGGS